VNRRAFIGLLGGAAAAWPLAARAQQGERVRRIGILLAGSENDREMRAQVLALKAGLQELGWTEGRNVRFEFRWPDGDPARTRAYAAELVALAPDVIVTGTTPAAIVMRQEPRLPVVFVNVADPVGTGLVASLAKPGGNMTGFTAFEFSITGKWLELLREIAPAVKRAALIFGAPEYATTGELFFRSFEAIARTSPIEPPALRLRGAADVDPAIDAFAAQPNVGLVAAAEPGSVLNRLAIINAVARHRLPAVYPFRYFATDGGLAAYGVSLVDQYRRAASYVDRILRSAKPSDLPVQAPDKFELIFNLKTAKAQGIEIPPTLLARADEVIE
jgi:putative ABC transport system substrate-binding protein